MLHSSTQNTEREKRLSMLAIGLGLFVIAAASKVGAFYLVSPTQVTSNLSVLELFAALGGIGWLGRHIFKLQ